MSPSRAAALLILSTLAPVVAACSSGEGYPSLARRPQELLGADGKPVATACPQCRRKGRPVPCPTPAPALGRVTGCAAVAPAEPPEPARPAMATTPGLAGRLAALVGTATAAHARFEGKRVAAEAQVAAAGGADPGSERWAQATMALSDLESAHSDTTLPLTELDRIEIDERMAHSGEDQSDSGIAAQAAEIHASSVKIEALVTDEQAVLDRLKGQLR